jgi:hypothetical protein
MGNHPILPIRLGCGMSPPFNLTNIGDSSARANRSRATLRNNSICGSNVGATQSEQTGAFTASPQQGLSRFGLPQLLAAVCMLPNKSTGGGLLYLVAILATKTLRRATYQTGPETLADSCRPKIHKATNAEQHLQQNGAPNWIDKGNIHVPNWGVGVRVGRRKRGLKMTRI